ncbi:hypothetical protein ScPMuIL_015401, partial [Solemya velum]
AMREWQATTLKLMWRPVHNFRESSLVQSSPQNTTCRNVFGSATWWVDSSSTS